MALDDRHYRDLTLSNADEQPVDDLLAASDTTPVADPLAVYDTTAVTEEIAALHDLDQRQLRREAAVTTTHLDEATALHDEIVTDVEDAIADAQDHLAGLSGYYDGEEAARDRLHKLRRERRDELRRHHREKRDLERELVAVAHELEADRQLEDVVRDVLGE